MGLAGYSAYILVDSLAIFITPTSESSLFSGRAGLAAMGTADERRVLFATLDDGGDRVLFGGQRHLREVTRKEKGMRFCSIPILIYLRPYSLTCNAFAG